MPVTRGMLQLKKFVPPATFKRYVNLTKHQRQGGGKTEKKSPTMSELILKKKQLLKEALEEKPTPLDGANVDQTYNVANLDLLSELDERVGAIKEESETDEYEAEYHMDANLVDGLDESDEEENDFNELDERLTKRGPTMMHKVHMRSFDKCEAIVLNEFGKPIAPVTLEKETVGEFSRFFGTIARDYGIAPLLHKTLKLVPNKEKMWEYVLYIILEQGREWVLKTIGASWRIQKCRSKKKYYYRYTNNKLSWLNCPKRVPADEFKKLLISWNKKAEKDHCLSNQILRKGQRNMHTACPKNPNKQLPSLAQLFERTRKRQENKRCANTYEDTTRKIEAMKNYIPPEDGSGLKDPYFGVTDKEYAGHRRIYVASAGVSYVVPDEVMNALSADVETAKTEIVGMRNELEVDYEHKKAELEPDYAKKMKEFDKSKDKMVQEVLQRLISKLPTNVVREFLT
ncbi:WD repeat-containing protein pop1 [Bienertia sinuspersici]